MTIRKAIKRSLFRINPHVAQKVATLWEGLSPAWSGKLSVRQAIRYLWFGMCPGVAGRFTYYRTRVYFPKGSTIFRWSCEQGGIYEPEVTAWLCRLAQPGKTFVDVGANIGLTSIPVLETVCHARVISFEPSPGSLPYLQRTWRESRFRERWEVVPKAAGDSIATVHFCSAAPNYSAFDGLRDTGSGGEKDRVAVLQTTVDVEWQRLGCPPVSLMKLDVEGAESKVLEGSHALIGRERPYILLEWVRGNLAPYETDVGFLVDYAASRGYEIFALPNLDPVTSIRVLEVHMLHTDMYLLVPKVSPSCDRTVSSQLQPFGRHLASH